MNEFFLHNILMRLNLETHLRSSLLKHGMQLNAMLHFVDKEINVVYGIKKL